MEDLIKHTEEEIRKRALEQAELTILAKRRLEELRGLPEKLGYKDMSTLIQAMRKLAPKRKKRAKLTATVIEEVRAGYAAGKTVIELSKQHGIAIPTIYAKVKGAKKPL